MIVIFDFILQFSDLHAFLEFFSFEMDFIACFPNINGIIIPEVLLDSCIFLWNTNIFAKYTLPSQFLQDNGTQIPDLEYEFLFFQILVSHAQNKLCLDQPNIVLHHQPPLNVDKIKSCEL